MLNASLTHFEKTNFGCAFMNAEYMIAPSHKLSSFNKANPSTNPPYIKKIQ